NPAGKHGFLRFEGKDFVFEDGTPIRFWGVNIASNRPFVDADVATNWTHFMTKYGINGVRFHKFTWDATDKINSTVISDDKWKNFDFFCKTLRDAGIYYSWSHIYGHRVLPGDSSRLLAYDEIANTKFPWSHLNRTTASLVNFAEDLQRLNIELTVNMLNHINPHTGKRYADDPALSFIELQNEDNIFWGAIEETLKQTPTYRKLLCQTFSQWLKDKYETQEALESAWKNQGLEKDASLDEGNIYPHPNHGYFSSAYEKAVKENRPVPLHITDRATFLYEVQLKFYQKFISAIRDTGYRGVIVGSCWQAGSGLSHFYNLHTDYVTGPIDRHNYFGGGTGHSLRPGKFDNTAMISKPGSGLLSTGFQQVGDRPFQISEWMSLIPTEWTAESSPLVAAYGMGLQGWDASYSFAMDFAEYTNTIHSHGVYNVTSPTQLGLYPALSIMVLRGDVKEAGIIANRNVNISDLENGKINFIEKTSQAYDVKRFESSVPMEALAIGGVTVSFNGTEKTFLMDLTKYWDHNKKLITSSTGQLQWSYDGKGYSTINTPGTKGLIGFAAGKRFTLGEVRIQTPNEFAVILISSLEQDKGINQAKRILVTAVARAHNTGMKFNHEKTELLEVGTAPILMEPVMVNLQIGGSRKGTVHVLDHVGSRTGETIPIRNGKLGLDGKKSKTIYYEIVFQ
ncbi:MAG TPA: hypothetical protein VIQ51_04315, partial [Chryseosolibacter sp.]